MADEASTYSAILDMSEIDSSNVPATGENGMTINFKSGKSIEFPHITPEQRNNRIAFFAKTELLRFRRDHLMRPLFAVRRQHTTRSSPNPLQGPSQSPLAEVSCSPEQVIRSSAVPSGTFPVAS
jgi:hypothetical protein